MDNEENKKILEKASNELCTALNKFGPQMVLDLLIVHSNRDEVVSYLLTQYPLTVALGDFLYRLPIFKPPQKRKGRKRKSRMASPTSQKRSSSLFSPT